MSEDSHNDFVQRDLFEKVKAESIARKEQIRELSQRLESLSGLEQQLTNLKIEAELARRGVAAEPDWVRVPEGGDVAEAVENFVAKYPHLTQPAQPTSVAPEQSAPAVQPGGLKAGPIPLQVQNTNPHIPGPAAQGTLPAWTTKEGLEKIEKDPKARAELSDWYRSQLSN